MNTTQKKFWEAWHELYPIYREVYPSMNTEFYLNELGLALRNVPEPAKVLICGAADWDTLNIVHQAVLQSSRTVQITMVDFWKEAITLSQKFAQEKGIQVKFYCKDILEWKTEEKFDIIVSDGILDFFNKMDQSALLEKWHSLLEIDGTVFTTVVVNPKPSPHWVPAVFSIAKKALNRGKNPLKAIYLQLRIWKSRGWDKSFATKAEFEEICEKTGFEIKYWGYFHNYAHNHWRWYNCKLIKTE